MLLQAWLTQSGERLFRWRSYVLLALLPLIALSLKPTENVERLLGGTGEELFEAFCIMLAVAGNALRAATVGFVPARTSGRNTHGQVAAELNTTGLYALTRNPLYLGNCAIYLGVVLYTQDIFLGLLVALVLAIYYQRIILAEEAFLEAKFGQTYRDWAARVPAFFPRRLNWSAPATRFSPRTVLRREYPGWFATVLALILIEAGGDFLEDEPGGWIDREWVVTLAVALAAYLTLRTVKRRSKLLHVEGR